MTMPRLISFLVLAVTVLAQNHDDHLPLPRAISTVNVIDDSAPEAPVKIFGTGDAYVKNLSGNRLMLWVEENNLQYQNVSGKDITSGKLEVLMTDVRGNLIQHVRALGVFRAGMVKKVQGMKQPDGRIHVPPGAQWTMSRAEYDLKPYQTPTVKAHVLEVTFTDGTTWKAQ
jgi:hypothetical protein